MASGDPDRQTTRDQLWHEPLRGGGEGKSFEAQRVSEHVGRAGRAGLEVEPTAGARAATPLRCVARAGRRTEKNLAETSRPP